MTLDDAVVLVERLLPGWSWEIRGGGSTSAFAEINMDGHLPCDADGPTPAIALVRALLHVLIATGER